MDSTLLVEPKFHVLVKVSHSGHINNLISLLYNIEEICTSDDLDLIIRGFFICQWLRVQSPWRQEYFEVERIRPVRALWRRKQLSFGTSHRWPSVQLHACRGFWSGG